MLALELCEGGLHEIETVLDRATDGRRRDRELGLVPPLEAEADVGGVRVEVVVPLDRRRIRVEVACAGEHAVVAVAGHCRHAVEADGTHVRLVEVVDDAGKRGLLRIVGLEELGVESGEDLQDDELVDVVLTHESGSEVASARFGLVGTTPELLRSVEIVKREAEIDGEIVALTRKVGLVVDDRGPVGLA